MKLRPSYTMYSHIIQNFVFIFKEEKHIFEVHLILSYQKNSDHQNLYFRYIFHLYFFFCSLQIKMNQYKGLQRV